MSSPLTCHGRPELLRVELPGRPSGCGARTSRSDSGQGVVLSRIVPVQPQGRLMLSPGRAGSSRGACAQQHPANHRDLFGDHESGILHRNTCAWTDGSTWQKLSTTTAFAPEKPAPDVYLAAARNIGIAPSECVVVEDAVSGPRRSLRRRYWLYRCDRCACRIPETCWPATGVAVAIEKPEEIFHASSCCWIKT